MNPKKNDRTFRAKHMLESCGGFTLLKQPKVLLHEYGEM
jgi:hypothetical protein